MCAVGTYVQLRCRSCCSVQISKMEVDYPDCEEVKLSELSDYPPRIVIDLTPTKQTSAPAVLDVMGLKNKHCFNIVNDCVPSELKI